MEPFLRSNGRYFACIATDCCQSGFQFLFYEEILRLHRYLAKNDKVEISFPICPFRLWPWFVPCAGLGFWSYCGCDGLRDVQSVRHDHLQTLYSERSKVCPSVLTHLLVTSTSTQAWRTSSRPSTGSYAPGLLLMLVGRTSCVLLGLANQDAATLSTSWNSIHCVPLHLFLVEWRQLSVSLCNAVLLVHYLFVMLPLCFFSFFLFFYVLLLSISLLRVFILNTSVCFVFRVNQCVSMS